MKDKALDIFIKMLFGIGGIIILVLIWSQPMALPERIIVASAGLVGLAFSLSRVIPLKFLLSKIGVIRSIPEVRPRVK